MSKKTHNLVQGSDEWRAHRAAHFNASEAAAMLGISPYMTRAELLRQKATGIAPEVDAATQRRFDDGHRYEEQAREWAEGAMGEELYPSSVSMVVQGLPLAASLDGETLAGRIWEHKTLNETIRKAADQGEIPEYIRVQIEHQLIVSGADRCLFMASNGDRETAVSLWYEHQPQYAQRILDGWKQFQKDLEAYKPEPEPEPAAIGARPESLPALAIQVEGRVLATNLDQFKAHAIAVFDGISTDLQTDQDFADAEAAVKWCKEVEDRLQAAKDAALAQTADIDALFKAIDDISDSARQKRLNLDRLVKARKEARKGEIQQQAVDALAKHIETINAGLSHSITLAAPAGFRLAVADAMKGKRTIQSLMDAADQALTDAKLAANAEADRIRANLAAFPGLAGEHDHLFADLRTLVGKPADDFAATIKLRISEHQARMAAKAEAERKAKADAEAMAARVAEHEERQRAEKQAIDKAREIEAQHKPVTAPAEEELITLGALNDILAPVTISAAGLAQFGFQPHSISGAAKLYIASDVPKICAALARHFQRVAEKRKAA